LKRLSRAPHAITRPSSFVARLEHLTPADYVRQPWKNGAGTTTELARNGPADGWLWRLSIADVDRAGPFSDFTGYRRIIVLLAGRGMTLSFDDGPPVAVDRRYRPFAFDGGLRTECALLDGPIRDMNLIVDDARVDASLDVRTVDDRTSFRMHAKDCLLLHAIVGRFEVALDHRAVALAPGHTLRIDDGAASNTSVAALEPDAVLAHAAIEYRR
jgi:uncharacterized protein